MPPRRNVRRYGDRKNYNKKSQMVRYDPKRSRRGFFPIPNLAQGARVVKLRFAINQGDDHSIASSTGSIVSYPYRANGMFDPYASAGGQQPRGFDQYMALFRHYTVHYSRVKLQFYLGSEATSNPMKVGVYLRDTTTALSSSQDIAEFPRTRQAVLTREVPVQKIVMGFNCRKFFHVKDPGDEANLHGTSGSDPAQQAAFIVFGYALNSQTETCHFTGYIDYIAVLHTPVLPAAS